MNCSHCGNTISPDAHFCPHCGVQMQAAPYYAPAPMYQRVPKHLQSLAVLWFVYAGLRLLTGLIGAAFVHTIFGHPFAGNDFSSLPFAHLIWPSVAVSLLVSVVCAALTGYALYTRQPWGRIFAIVFAIFALIHLPFGTALGIYTLWVLAPRLSGLEYDALTSRRQAA